MTKKTDIERLRELILGLEIEELRVLREQIDDPSKLSALLGKILPEAIDVNVKEEDPGKLAEALKPIIINTLHKSVKEDSKPLADALFPVMGPAIRKSIAETLKKMLQAVNETLENSFSARALNWRVQSWFTGKSYAEIVLLNTLEYRVNQVFLIHKESGLLLQQAQSKMPLADNADMVSGMLSAIQDFVRDSFNVGENSEIDTIEFGAHTIWIKQGPYAILASVVEGNAPKDIGIIFEEALEKIHGEFHLQFDDFKGDTTAFENNTTELETCLVLQEKVKKKKKKLLPYLIIFLLAALLSCWIITCIITNHKNHKFVEHLNESPGLVVIESDKSWGKLHIHGLKDPLADDPASVAEDFNIKARKLHMKWEPYIALSPEIVLKRAAEMLNPPENIDFSILNDTLLVKGVAPFSWVKNKLNVISIPGIRVITRDFEILEYHKADSLRSIIQNTVITYETGVSRLNSDQKLILDNLYSVIMECVDLQQYIGTSCRICINGSADSSGTISNNIYLSKKRSEYIMNYLSVKGISPSVLQCKGVGDNASEINKLEMQERCVKFEVIKN